MTEPTFRQATTDDAAAVHSVAQTLWDELGDRSGFPQQPTADGIAGIIGGDKSAVFVCEQDGAVCGFSTASPDADSPERAAMGVWLLPSARGHGTGRELALMATDFARDAGYQKLRGTLPPNNEQALSFFSEIATLAQVVGQGMEYELPL